MVSDVLHSFGAETVIYGKIPSVTECKSHNGADYLNTQYVWKFQMKISLSLLFAFALIACSTHSEDPCKGPMIPTELLVSGACEEELSEDFGWQPAGIQSHHRQ